MEGGCKRPRGMSSDGLCVCFFFICAVGLWVLRPLLAYCTSPWMIGDGDCGKIGGMNIDKGNRSTRIKLVPAPLCPPQIPHD
jgi:hypothetical protein